jgi:hypothetical protein
MSDPERVLMAGTAKGLALEKDRIFGGAGTSDGLTAEDVGFALAGMKEAGVPAPVRERVSAALHYLVLGDENSRFGLYRALAELARGKIQAGRWPERIGGHLYDEALCSLVLYAHVVRPLDAHLACEEGAGWQRELAPKYRDLREAMREWVRIGVGHVRKRTTDLEDDDG